MIDETLLRDDLIRLLTATENNIRSRCEEDPAVNRPLEDSYQAARQAGRTGMTFTTWREGEITQAGVAWLLACVFVRFLEDNDFLDRVYLSGPGTRLRTAQDRRTVWYRNHTASNDRDYLLGIFSELEHLPGLKGLLDRTHNPLWSLGPDGDGAKAIWDFFQSADPDSQVLRHDFTDTVKSTRFLGDLYQNISESARKHYALVQTPEFIVEFILNRTLLLALDEFGLNNTRLIDPACGSGHFLLHAFGRLLPQWLSTENEPVVAVQQAFDRIVGVDLNPYAVAIARFRLLVAALCVCGIPKLVAAPDWRINITAGDSLLFGPHNQNPRLWSLATEDPDGLDRCLRLQTYQVVIGNPPYINVQDAELRAKYRELYSSCSGKYQVSVPFTELFFQIAAPQGYIGMITSNAFMKKAFGKVLIERRFPCWDLTHVIDSQGVHLNSFGTPTVMLIGRNRAPIASTLRVVRGIRGESSRPEDPENAPVWTEIRDHVDQPGFEGRYSSVADAPRDSFHRHPWSIGGGGAAELKERIDGTRRKVSDEVGSVGITSFTLADDIYFLTRSAARAKRLDAAFLRSIVTGEALRDWEINPSNDVAVFPYNARYEPVSSAEAPTILRYLWRARSTLRAGVLFGSRSKEDCGLKWYEYGRLTRTKLRTPLSIAFASVATHGHFVIDRGKNLLNRHAPVVKLPDSATEAQHLSLMGILNSSVACFWFRQVCRSKGTGGIGGGLATEVWEQFFEFDATLVGLLPLPANRPTDLATAIQTASDERSSLLPAALIARQTPTRASLDIAQQRAHELLLRMIALQEELDWYVYHLYGLLNERLTLPIDEVPPVQLGERTFEIAMARAIENGDLETEWYNRHRSTPRTDMPDHWPQPYRALIQRRLDAIASDHDIALIEQPEYKRRWNLAPWEELERQALCTWLLDRLEDSRYWPNNPPALTSVARLADRVRSDAEFLQVAEVYRGRPDFDVEELVQELVAHESVPFLPLLRYKESGLRKRLDWERTWELQRKEDGGEKIEAPVPPKYERVDYVSADYWRLRGKLDVPKERWISYPYLQRDADKSPVIAWAGYDHGQQALALAGYANEMRLNEGWPAERLIPVLAGLDQLQPWLDQWHNQIDTDRQQRLNESIRTFVESEMTQLGITAERIHEWRPPARVTAKPRKGRPQPTTSTQSPVSND